jgi:flagellin-like protein
MGVRLKMKNKNEQAVSPVIGVVLMVAITVILAAVIATFVFGMSGQTKETKLVSITAQRVSPAMVVFVNHGGKDVTALTNLTIQGDGSGMINTPVGSSTTIIAPPAPAHFQVVARFMDDTEQVVLDIKV